jgi:hypothetical protein
MGVGNYTKRVRFTHRSKRSTFASLMPEGKIAVAQANLRLEKGKSEDDESARHRFIAGRMGLREELDHPREQREHGALASRLFAAFVVRVV